jgi:rhodanese-related sulfurtransferase
MRYLSTAVLVLALGCRGQAQLGGWSRVPASELQAELAVGPGSASRLVIVDVREPELFAKGHLPGATNLPYPGAKQRAPLELDRADRIVLVCHRGPMGDEVAAILVARGFTHVRNLAGGMDGWTGPVEPGS